MSAGDFTAGLRPAVVGSATAIALVAGVLWWRNGAELVVEDTTFVILAWLAIVIGELWRVSLDYRTTAPVAVAGAMALTLTPIGPDATVLRAAQVFVVVLGAVFLALGIRVALGWSAGVDEVTARLVGLGVTVVLSRNLTIEGRPVLAWATDARAWQAALVLIAMCAAGIFVELLTWTLIFWKRRVSLVSMVREDLMRSGALGSAVAHAGPLVALVTPVAGPSSLILVLGPLALAMAGLRRRERTEAIYRETVAALSRLTDDSGHTRPGHARRVADLCRAMGQHLLLSDREVDNLERAALLHDVGQVALTVPLPGGASILADPDSQRRIADESVRIGSKAGVEVEVGEAIIASTQQFRVMREFGETIPLAARILKVANAYDDLTGGRGGPTRSAALERIQLGLGYEYDPTCVDALARVTKAPPG